MMETNPPGSDKTLLLVGGACGLLALFACVMITLVGAGSLAWLTIARTDTRQALPFPVQGRAPAAVTAARGFVEVLGPDGRWSPALADQPLGEGQRVRTGALSSADLRFADGSAVTLQANSEIAIDRLKVEPDDGSRVILLSQLTGQSSHQVAHNDLPGSQYRVDSPYGQGEAKGTAFTVIVIAATEDGQAGHVEYEVSEGVVAVTALEITVEVSAGQITTILDGEAPLEPVMSISGQGLVTQTGETWVIAGQEFVVTPDTLISGDPQVGDWAVVRGRVRADGANEALWVALLRAAPANRFSISGPVEATGDAEWTVQGQKIRIDAQTEIDAGLAVGDRVRVTGLVIDSGVLQAKRIERVETDSGLSFDFTGVVEEQAGSGWTISGQDVLVDGDTEIEAELAAGDVVRVAGVIQEDGAWLAHRITAAPDELSSFHLAGKLESLDPWQVAGVVFETREWTVIEAGLERDDLVRVEGQIDEDGLWIADTIERLEAGTTRLVLTGAVISIDPWVVNGIPITVSDTTVIDAGIEVGMLVRVEIVIGADGAWQIVRITRLDDVIWFPGCMDIVATVAGLRDNDIQLKGWPLMDIEDDVQVEGRLAVGNTVRIRVCLNDEHRLRIVTIIIIQVDQNDDDQGEDEGSLPDGGKVLVCHKPGKKKGGHTLSIGRPALGAHLGHGDYIGACR